MSEEKKIPEEAAKPDSLPAENRLGGQLEFFDPFFGNVAPRDDFDRSLGRDQSGRFDCF
ncbi:MAG: hypothetical protein WDN67_05530 [Candidatus Moraniibacteriota bacterium]